MGVERSFPNTMRLSPTTFFSLDLPHPRTENGISKLAIWMRQSTSNTILGLWFRISYEYLMLEINQPGHLFAVDYSKWSFLATDYWIKDLWQFVWEHSITLSPPLLATLHIQRINDQYLMPWFKSLRATDDELIILNRCRMVLKVISLADISSGNGSYILTQALQPQTWNTSLVAATWPDSKAKHTDWDTWKQLIKDGSSSTSTLQHPLGRWTGFLHEKSKWRFDPTTEILYGSHNDGQWDIYTKVRMQPACRGATFHHKDSGELPNHTL
eukprot:7507797-Ditylum_brightwellii.AAC.1